MKDEIVMAILQAMTPVLDQEQLARLKVLSGCNYAAMTSAKKRQG